MNLSKLRFILLITLLTLSAFPVFSQLTVTPGRTAAELATTLSGPGVTILSPTLTCPGVANGTFTSTGTLLAMSNGIILTNGHAAACAGPYGPPPGTASFNDGAPGDPLMAPFLPPGIATFDACILQFDVVASGDSVGFNYQFGSQEYYSAVCSEYDDVFAFFISGPGIVGTPNLALVPGTTIPVEINSVNNGIPGSSGGSLPNCTGLGAGSPFTSYYLDNTGGTLLSYKGFTTKFRAVHSVTPCDTYHIRLSIVDAGNGIYDSGVFLEAGSLTTNNFTFNHADSVGGYIAGLDHTIVRGCTPATLTVISGHILGAAESLHFTYRGTAVEGADFVGADSTIMAAGTDSVRFAISAIPPAAGVKTIFIYLTSPSSCGILDSFALNIIDAPSAAILTPDTIICPGRIVPIRATSSANLTYSWSPATGLSSTTILEPMATPTITTTYILSAMLPGSGCPPLLRDINITMDSLSVSLLTPDTIICKGQSVHIRATGPDSLAYTWSPAAGLDSIHSRHPIAIPDSNTTYILTGNSANGCFVTKQFTVSLLSVVAGIYNPDTAICRGASVQVRAYGDPSISYQWLPTAGIPHSTLLNPVITADTSAIYYLTGSVPGCHEAMDSIRIDVQPNPQVYLGTNRSVCNADTIHINAYVTPQWYTHYAYHWSPAINLFDSNASVAVFTAGDSTKLLLTVTTPAGCTTKDSVQIFTHGIAQDSLANHVLCPGDSVRLLPNPEMSSYHWSPGMYLSDTTSPDPWVRPITSEDYRLIEYNQFGCRDTVRFNVTVRPSAVIDLGDSVTLHPGQSYQINPQTNCSSFTWFPPSGLSNASISNPLATPELSTRYIVHAVTEWGCKIVDSIDINVDPGTVLALPNAFTPGGGVNNTLKIIKIGEATLTYFRIYNRWGNLVYESTDIDEGWDGRFNGMPQPFGVFVYVIEAKTSTGTPFNKHGNITLIR